MQWIQTSGESFLPGANTENKLCTSTVDMFPSKVGGISADFSIEYRNTYKIVTNKVAKTVYVLYQRGCEKPTLSGYSNITAFFQVFFLIGQKKYSFTRLFFKSDPDHTVWPSINPITPSSPPICTAGLETCWCGPGSADLGSGAIAV